MNTTTLGPKAKDLLVALCNYVAQHGNTNQDAKWAAEVLAAGVGQTIVPGPRELSVGALSRARKAITAKIKRVEEDPDDQNGNGAARLNSFRNPEVPQLPEES